MKAPKTLAGILALSAHLRRNNPPASGYGVGEHRLNRIARRHAKSDNLVTFMRRLNSIVGSKPRNVSAIQHTD